MKTLLKVWGALTALTIAVGGMMALIANVQDRISAKREADLCRQIREELENR